MDLRRPSFTDPHRTSSYHSGSSINSTSVRSSPNSDALADADGVDNCSGNLDERSDEGTVGHVRRSVGNEEFERGVGLLDSVEAGTLKGSWIDQRGDDGMVEIHQMPPLNIPKRSSSRRGLFSSFPSIAEHSPDTPTPALAITTHTPIERINIFAPGDPHFAMEDDVDIGDTSTSTLGLGVGDDPFAPVWKPSPRRVRGLPPSRTLMNNVPFSSTAKWPSSPRRPTHQPSLETIKRPSTIASQDERRPETSDEEPVGVIAALERNQEDVGDLYPGTSEAFESMAVQHQTKRTPRRTPHVVSSSSSTPRPRSTAQPDRRHTSLTMRYAMGDSPTPPVPSQARINHIDSDDDPSQDGSATIVPKTFPRTFVSPRRHTRPHRRRAVSSPLDLDSRQVEFHLSEEDQDLSLDADPPRELGLRFPAISPRRSLLLTPGPGQGAGRSPTTTWSVEDAERNLSAASRLATKEYPHHWAQPDDPVMDEMSMRRVKEEVEVVRRRSGYATVREMGEDNSRQALEDDVVPVAEPGGNSHLGAILYELRFLRGEVGDLRQDVRVLAGSRTARVTQEADPAEPKRDVAPGQQEITTMTIPNLTDALGLIRKLDILVHHLPQETNADDQQPITDSRTTDQVFSVDNLALLGQTIEDWECVIRGRGVQ